MASVDAVLPAPGLPEAHPLFRLAADADRPVLSEFDLAGAWDDRPVAGGHRDQRQDDGDHDGRADAPRSGRRTVAVGNLDVPLVQAIDDPAPEMFTVEASSFRLAHSRRFAPLVGTWLNFAEDHLDVHRTVQDYRRAKARIWADQGIGDTAVVNAEDPVVAADARLLDAGPSVVRYGLAAEIDGSRPTTTRTASCWWDRTV